MHSQIEAATGAEACKNLKAFLAWLQENGAQPRTNGKAPATQPATTEEAPVCEKHDTPFREYRNDKGSWWAHKLADGSWCHKKNGKTKAA